MQRDVREAEMASRKISGATASALPASVAMADEQRLLARINQIGNPPNERYDNLILLKKAAKRARQQRQPNAQQPNAQQPNDVAAAALAQPNPPVDDDAYPEVRWCVCCWFWRDRVVHSKRTRRGRSALSCAALHEASVPEQHVFARTVGARY